MSKTPWTPGPWTFYERQDYDPAYGVKAPAPYHWVIPPLNLNQADCQLIALAPEMAEALRAVHSTYRTFRDVPKHEQEWTSIDDDVMTAIDSILSRLPKGE